MRALLLLSIAALVCLPAASALPGVPTIAVRIDQSSLRVNASRSDQPVIFTGSVSITKSPYLSATVTLTGTVNKGWNSSVEPASMTFTTTAPQAFTCTVLVPGGTLGATDAQLSVDGTVVSGIFTNSSAATAMITIMGTLPPANQTGNGTGGTKPSNGNNTTILPKGWTTTQVSDGLLGFSWTQLSVVGVVAIIALIAVGVTVKVRRRNNAALTVETVEED